VVALLKSSALGQSTKLPPGKHVSGNEPNMPESYCHRLRAIVTTYPLSLFGRHPYRRHAQMLKFVEGRFQGGPQFGVITVPKPSCSYAGLKRARVSSDRVKPQFMKIVECLHSRWE
jgi:hypothetical protein